MSSSAPSFRDAIHGLLRGDFSRLEPLLDNQVVEWHRPGSFEGEPEALAEAFSCACFNGHTDVAE